MALSFAPALKGEFQNTETKKWFSYVETKDAWAVSQGLTHEIHVLDGVRFGNVLKTVAHIAVDEAADGKAVMESWKIQKHSIFTV